MTNEDDLGLITKPSSHSHSSNSLTFNNNLIIAFCLDGTVYALDSGNGAILWRTSGSFTDGALLKKRRRIKGNKRDKEVEYLIEPLGEGSIFQKTSGNNIEGEEEVKRLPFTLKSLVQLSPVHWQESEELGHYLIAKRESSIYLLDLLSGNVKKRQFKGKHGESSSDEEMAIESMERASLLVGRTDYHVQGFDEGNLDPQWEINLTQFKSLHQGQDENEVLRFNGNDFYTTFNGHLVSKQAGEPWIAKLNSPVLQIFRPMTTGKGFVTLQEMKLKGSDSGAIAAKRHVLFDQSRATFYFDDLVNVGILNSEGNSSTSTLFVLPQSHYPLLRDREKKKKPKIGEEEVGLIVKRHAFLSVQRVSRQVIPATIKLLDYENQSFKNLKLFSFAISMTLFVGFVAFRWMSKWYRKQKHEGKRGSSGVLELSEEVLGYGSHGTVVFRGKFDGRPVAIKRLLSEFYSLADHEISLLQEHDTHPNVVRYFYREEQERFILVALELASCSLAEFIDPIGGESSGSSTCEAYKVPEIKAKEFSGIQVDEIDLLKQVMGGLLFLHEKGLIHRDLKPQNILLQFPKAAQEKVRVLISDFGLSRKLIELESSFHATAKASGTLGWRAPEIIFNEETVKYNWESKAIITGHVSNSTGSHDKDIESHDSASTCCYGPLKIGKSVDIFAAGLIFYYVLSGGKHAFGSRMLRESNISTGKLEINTSFLNFEAENLIKEMLKKRAKDRPTAKQILSHPFFWDSEKRLEFICSVSDVLEGEERSLKREQVEKAPPGFESTTTSILPMRDSIDFIGTKVFKEAATWHKALDRLIFQDLTKHRYYMVNKLHDLLRAIRNKRNHFNETPANVQEILGTSPIEAWEYFEAKFPRMLMECHQVMSKFVLKSTENNNFKSLEKYYER